jgi:hypothetical protein
MDRLRGRSDYSGIEIPVVWNQMLELVSLTFASWNQIVPFLQRIDQLRCAGAISSAATP